MCEPIHKLKYCGNTTNLFKHLQTVHPRVYSDMKNQAKQDASPSSYECSSSNSKSIKECLSGYEKYNSDSPRAKELTKAVGYFIAKDLMPTSVVQGDGFRKLLEKAFPQHSMIQDVETRWNSTYNMLERICEQQASICAALVDLKRVDLMLQDSDVKIMENLVEILKPFFQITETICGENYTTVSSIKPLLHHLLNTALDPRSNDLGAIKQLKEAVKQNLQQRYQDTETAKLLDIACFLDPRFKELPFLSVVERTALHNLVREEAAAIYTDILSAKKES